MRVAQLTLSILLVGLGSAHPQYPSGGGNTDDSTTGATCPAYTHDCVPYYQCVNGLINTDGAGLIDVRITDPNAPVPLDCTNQEYPGVPAVCCQIPGAVAPTPAPITACPNGLVCIEESQCNADGSVNTDGAGNIDVRILLKCYISGTDYVGVCCKPPPLDSCYIDQQCLPEGQCIYGGSSVEGAATYEQTCFVDKANYVVGRCCDPPIQVIDVCPGNSVCNIESLCTGEILDTNNNYVPYGNSGLWSKCALGGNNQNTGVCCLTPIVVTEPPYKPASQCGIINNVLNVRAGLNKNEAQFGEFPWQAVLFFSNFTFKCGASLIADKWLLTGAHCVHGYYPKDFKVRLGEWRVDTYDEPKPYVDVEIAAISIHPNFNSENLHNDVAVIELATPVTFEYHINTVCLPSPNQLPSPGTRCFATGWGKDAFEGAYQAILKKVDVPYVEKQYCQDLLRQTRLGKFFQLDKSFICAGGEENQDACTGDGGGPLVCEDPNTGAYYLQGITAWGINCGQLNVPGVYVDVQYFTDYIISIIEALQLDNHSGSGNAYGRK